MNNLKVKFKQRLADIETPVSAYLKLCARRPDSILLESSEAHEQIGRYSILAFDPLTTLELLPDKLLITSGRQTRTRPVEEFFEAIRQIGREFGTGPLRQMMADSETNLPAVGSLMGYIGYNAVRLIEGGKLGAIPASGADGAGDQPVARLMLPACYLIFDHYRRLMHLIALGVDEAQCDQRIEALEKGLSRKLEQPEPGQGLELTPPPREAYLAAVKAAKEHIKAGDIFQVVVADAFQGRTGVDPFEVYRLLRVKSPSPYMFFLNFGSFKLAGASPETMVKVDNGSVILHPIAGTRGRSEDPAGDLALEQELLASEKERAEHVMLVDLARNDAGRVSEGGSVAVEPFMIVQRFSHVMHLVSRVKGRLRQGADAVDAFKAGFPAGTVSGAPKIRALQIIDELEVRPRGVYSGAVGWFGADNQLDTCIAIRIIVFKDQNFTIPVGAGIVADSDPAEEYTEIMNKAAQSVAVLKSACGGIY